MGLLPIPMAVTIKCRVAISARFLLVVVRSPKPSRLEISVGLFSSIVVDTSPTATKSPYIGQPPYHARMPRKFVNELLSARHGSSLKEDARVACLVLYPGASATVHGNRPHKVRPRNDGRTSSPPHTAAAWLLAAIRTVRDSCGGVAFLTTIPCDVLPRVVTPATDREKPAVEALTGTGSRKSRRLALNLRLDRRYGSVRFRGGAVTLPRCFPPLIRNFAPFRLAGRI